MRIDTLKKFVSMRDTLAKEKVVLEARLAQINEALAVSPGPAASASKAVGESRGPATRGRGRRRAAKGRATNQLSLREAVMQVTKNKPLSRQEILDGVKKLGYQFAAKDPLNSLSTLLYTTKAIKNYGGKFGPG